MSKNSSSTGWLGCLFILAVNAIIGWIIQFFVETPIIS